MVAHHLLVDEAGGVITGHRYLMVIAIQLPYQRGGYASAILDVMFERLRAGGVDSVDWLVHPSTMP